MSRIHKPAYSSYIKDMPFLFLEMRKAAKLIAGGAAIDTIIPLSINGNIFQLDKEKRRLKLAQRVVLRLSALTGDQIALLAAASDETAKLIAFYALIKTDLLFFEFMNEVYAEKLSVGQNDISDKDIISFLHNKEDIAQWTDNNFTRVKNTYKAILCEAGLAVRAGVGLNIKKPFIDDTLVAAFRVADVCTAAMGLEV